MRAHPSLTVGLRFDMRAPHFGATPERLYSAALELTAWADRVGFDFVRVSEHHGARDGYCPSPLTLLAALAGRTSRIALRARVIVLPLHDPIRLAEDAAIVDLISNGRLELVLAGGYVPSEFAMFGKELKHRGRDVEDGIALLQQAWRGAAFEYRGRPGRLGIRPSRPGGPPLSLGGSAPVAARRAARLGIGFEPTTPDLFEAYVAECERLGTVASPPPAHTLPGSFLHVTKNPEAAWERLGPHLLHEVRAYNLLLRDTGTASRFAQVDDSAPEAVAMAEIRASGRYRLLTPDEAISAIDRLPRPALVEFSPLVAGLDPEEGLASMELFAAEVLPRLRAD